MSDNDWDGELIYDYTFSTLLVVLSLTAIVLNPLVIAVISQQKQTTVNRLRLIQAVCHFITNVYWPFIIGYKILMMKEGGDTIQEASVSRLLWSMLICISDKLSCFVATVLPIVALAMIKYPLDRLYYTLNLMYVYMAIFFVLTVMLSRTIYLGQSRWLPSLLMWNDNFSKDNLIWLVLIDIPYDIQCLLAMVSTGFILLNVWQGKLRRRRRLSRLSKKQESIEVTERRRSEKYTPRYTNVSPSLKLPLESQSLEMSVIQNHVHDVADNVHDVADNHLVASDSPLEPPQQETPIRRRTTFVPSNLATSIINLIMLEAPPRQYCNITCSLVHIVVTCVLTLLYTMRSLFSIVCGEECGYKFVLSVLLPFVIPAVSPVVFLMTEGPAILQ